MSRQTLADRETLATPETVAAAETLADTSTSPPAPVEVAWRAPTAEDVRAAAEVIGARLEDARAAAVVDAAAALLTLLWCEAMALEETDSAAVTGQTWESGLVS